MAEQAGVSKATIYRWWPSKEILALAEAVYRARSDDEAGEPDRGSGARRRDPAWPLQPEWLALP